LQLIVDPILQVVAVAESLQAGLEIGWQIGPGRRCGKRLIKQEPTGQQDEGPENIGTEMVEKFPHPGLEDTIGWSQLETGVEIEAVG
jgi:hypothetical protein